MVGHATTLVQLAGVNILTDPVWSKRASPFSFAGPGRATEPGIALLDFTASGAREAETRRIDLITSSQLGALRFNRLRHLAVLNQ